MGRVKSLDRPVRCSARDATRSGVGSGPSSRRSDAAWLASLTEGLPARRLPVADYAEHLGRHFSAVVPRDIGAAESAVVVAAPDGVQPAGFTVARPIQVE